MFENTISVVDTDSLLSLFGPRDQNLRKIREALAVDISAHDHQIHIAGERDAVTQATEVLEQLKAHVDRHGPPSLDEVSEALTLVQAGRTHSEVLPIEVLSPNRKVRPRTPGQVRYVEAMRHHDLVLGNGPAGTGKTYLAVAMAVSAEMVDYDQLKRYMETDVIEVIPLAYMRGRTLNEAFIILDEAQNTTVSQMKMFLTRMGRGSKIVVSGDNTQVDLPAHTQSGLTDALGRLRGIEGVAQVQLTNADIVRHRLVQEILRAYAEGPRKGRHDAQR